MALYSDVGASCSLKDCKQHDFLPFKCESCSGTFCLEHRTSESHNCQVKRHGVFATTCPKCSRILRVNPGEDSQTVLNRHGWSDCKPVDPPSMCPVQVSCFY